MQTQAAQALAPLTRQMHAQAVQALAPLTRQMQDRIVEVVAPRARLAARIAAPQFQIDLTHLMPALEGLRRLVEEATPPNWIGADFRFELARKVVVEDGIPLVWVPRGETVAVILAAESRPTRIAALVSFGINTLRTGCAAAAQALAVLVVEALIRERIADSYKEARAKARFDRDASIRDLRTLAAVAPVRSFYRDWQPSSRRSVPAPRNLARHATVHGGPRAGHLTPSNALLAVMLLTSLIREVQEWHNEGRHRSDQP